MNAQTPTIASVDIRMAEDRDAVDWNGYVNETSSASFFHLWEWGEVTKSAYGYAPIRLVAHRAGKVVGILPLVDVTSSLLGRSLISTAFTVGGGIVADDAQAASALAGVAVDIGRIRRVRYVELRSEQALLEGWQTKSGVYASFKKTMLKDEEEHFASLPRRRRRNIQKAITLAEAGDIAVRFDCEPDVFYDLFAKSMRNHGTPVFSKKFLYEILGRFGDRVDIAVVEQKNEPVAALLSFYFRDRVMPYYLGAAPRARDDRASFYLNWKLMRHAVEKGACVFDFGRSKYGSGAFDHKVYWGLDPEPLEYQYALIEANQTPNVNPDNPKFKMATQAWRRLPLPVANMIGPLIARHLP